MTIEFARKRIAKIREDYSRSDLNNRLGFKNKDNKSAEDFIGWIEVR